MRTATPRSSQGFTLLELLIALSITTAVVALVFAGFGVIGRTEERKKHFGGPRVRRGARIGANATLLPGLEIGEDALVAAGSVVTRDVPPGVVVAGNPARVVRDVAPEQRLENQTYYEG